MVGDGRRKKLRELLKTLQHFSVGDIVQDEAGYLGVVRNVCIVPDNPTDSSLLLFSCADVPGMNAEDMSKLGGNEVYVHRGYLYPYPGHTSRSGFGVAGLRIVGRVKKEPWLMMRPVKLGEPNA